MKFILNWFLSTLAIIIATYIINSFWPGAVVISSLWAALIAALILGIVNALIKPVAQIIALPLTILSLGLFALVVNALMVMLVSWLSPGFSVSGFFVAFVYSIILSLISWALHKISM